jgi:hypothetical protein
LLHGFSIFSDASNSRFSACKIITKTCKQWTPHFFLFINMQCKLQSSFWYMQIINIKDNTCTDCHLLHASLN